MEDSKPADKKLALWAYSLIVAIIAAVATVFLYLIEPNGALPAATLAIAIVGTAIGGIQYLLTKVQAK